MGRLPPDGEGYQPGVRQLGQLGRRRRRRSRSSGDVARRTRRCWRRLPHGNARRFSHQGRRPSRAALLGARAAAPRSSSADTCAAGPGRPARRALPRAGARRGRPQTSRRERHASGVDAASGARDAGLRQLAVHAPRARKCEDNSVAQARWQRTCDTRQCAAHPEPPRSP